MAPEPCLTAVEDISGDEKEDTLLLREMALSARKFITAHEWCPPIAAMYFADGVGGVVALFLVEFEAKIAGTDSRLWIVNGDLPDAYLVVEPNDSSREALERYCLLMDDWIEAVRTSGDFTSAFPVRAKPTVENADLLAHRLDFLRQEIIPQFRNTPI